MTEQTGQFDVSGHRADEAGADTGTDFNTDDVAIEPMTPSDLPEVLAIEKASFPTPWSRHAFIGELTQNTSAKYIVARWLGQVIGYAGMWIITDEAHVTNIAVHPGWRRRRVGDGLLLALESEAVRHGCVDITLEVRRSNHGAQRLYAKHGFEPRGLRRGYYTDNNEDAIIMGKRPLTAAAGGEAAAGRRGGGSFGSAPGMSPGGPPRRRGKSRRSGRRP